MTAERWIVIPGWEKFQHRDAARALIPTWIKVYTELMSKDGFFELSFHCRGVLLSLWLEYATSKRQLRDSTVSLTRRLGQRVTTRDLESLNRAGFIEFSASRPASTRASRVAVLEEKRVETDVEEPEPSLLEPNPPTHPELQDALGGRVDREIGLERLSPDAIVRQLREQEAAT